MVLVLFADAVIDSASADNTLPRFLLTSFRSSSSGSGDSERKGEREKPPAASLSHYIGTG